MLKSNDPSIKSWVEVSPNSDFPIQNLPFGIYSIGNGEKQVGVALGNYIIDMAELANLGYLDATGIPAHVYLSDYLNDFMEYGRQGTRKVRERLSEIFRSDSNELRGNSEDQKAVLIPMEKVQMHLPIKVGDYTDFYSSKEHATNVGTMFRDPANALLPNWLHIPVGYHGRSSSIIVSGQPIHRPKGQQRPNDNEPPVFGPGILLDFELEMAFITYQGKPLGQSISVEEAEDYMFGFRVDFGLESDLA